MRSRNELQGLSNPYLAHTLQIDVEDVPLSFVVACHARNVRLQWRLKCQVVYDSSSDSIDRRDDSASGQSGCEAERCSSRRNAGSADINAWRDSASRRTNTPGQWRTNAG